MRTRTHILAYLILLVLVAAMFGIDYLNDTAGSVIIGLLAAVTLYNLAYGIARIFTGYTPPAAPQARNTGPATATGNGSVANTGVIRGNRN